MTTDDIDSLRRDAERYRWLRGGGGETIKKGNNDQYADSLWLAAGYSVTESGGNGSYMSMLEGENLDDAIDAAISSPENPS